VAGQHIAKDIVRYKDGHQPGQFVQHCIGFEQVGHHVKQLQHHKKDGGH